MTKKIKVKAHKRKGKKVKSYLRKNRGKGKKRIIRKKAVKLYPIVDEFGQFKGWSRKRK